MTRSFDELLPEIVDCTHGVESERLRCLASRSRGLRIVAIVFVVSAVCVLGASSQNVIAAVVLGILSLIGLFVVHQVYVSRPYQNYRRDFKTLFVGRLLQSLAEDISYYPEGDANIVTEYKSSELFPRTVDRETIEDTVYGRVGQTDLKFSQLHTEYKTTSTDSKGRKTTHWHTIFKGLFISADFHKDFRGTTFVRSDVAEKTFGAMGRMFQKPIFSSLQLVELEDPDFEQQFVVLSSDQVEARYVLTPSMMEKMLALKAKFSSQVEFSFVRSRMFIAVSTTQDFFEPDLHKTLYDNQYLRNYVEQIQLCLGVVEDLGLNTRIWSK